MQAFTGIYIKAVHLNSMAYFKKHPSVAARWIMILAGTALLFSCRQDSPPKDAGTTTVGNKTETISTDTAKLSKLINLSTFKPMQVKFKYTHYDNSGKNERLGVPGPSDGFLEAVLYFDSATFMALKRNYNNIDYKTPDYDKEDFNFTWLDKEVKQELAAAGSGYHGQPDYFFTTGQSGKLWLLHNKVLLKAGSN